MIVLTPVTADIISFLYDSPVVIAIISVLAVKGLDVLSDQIKFIGQGKKEINTRLWEEIAELKKQYAASESKNDALIISVAEAKARISILESQNAQHLADLLEVRQERDNLRQQLKEAGEWMHKLGLENEAAKRRIQSLEEEVQTLKEHK